MKKYLGLFLALLITTITLQAQSKEESRVAAAVDSFNQALIHRDRSRLEKLTADELSYGHSSGKVQNKEEFVNDVASGPFQFLTIDATGQTVKLAGNTAIVRHIFTSKATNNGAPTDIKIGILQVWQKQKGEWKLLARQAFKV